MENIISRIILFVVLGTMLLPVRTIFGFTLPLEYLLIPFSAILVLKIVKREMLFPPIFKSLFIVVILIFIEIIIGTFISTYIRFGYIVIPRDVLQYVIKFTFMFSFAVLTYNKVIDKNMFIKYFLITLIIAMTIGILQWIPWPGREFMIRLYPFRDGSLQLSQLGRDLDKLRLHGFAQHATSNGGFGAFSFIFGVSIFSYFNRHRILSAILILLAIINIFASQGRAGMLALVFSIILFFVLDMIINKRYKKTILLFSTAAISIMSIITILYYSGNEIIVRTIYRWEVLIKTLGGVRATEQPQYFFSIMENRDFIFGLSKPIINISEISHGVEVEPMNILISYGIVGFVLQYGLILLLLVHLFKRIKPSMENKAEITLIIAAFVGLSSYVIFSLGYSFLREIKIGVFPWILIGAAIGIYEKRSEIIGREDSDENYNII